jgi:hypothetical protein
MSSERVYAAAATSDTNKVLVHGGLKYTACPSGCFHATSNIYNFSTNSWSAGPTSVHARAGHTLTNLATTFGPGQVLAAGGTSTGTAGITQCEKYNPATGLWISAGTLHVGVWFHAAAKCGSSPGLSGNCEYSSQQGKVLVTGGTTGPWQTTSYTQVYNPTNNSWHGDLGMFCFRAKHAWLIGDAAQRPHNRDSSGWARRERDYAKHEPSDCRTYPRYGEPAQGIRHHTAQ